MWAIVYSANIVGGGVFAGIAVLTGPAIGIASSMAFAEISTRLIRYSWWATVLSGVLAGWLMGLLSWLVRASRDTISILFVVWIIADAIGFAHLPHSIAGNVKVLMGVFAGHVGLAPYAKFVSFATVGNAVGGVVFVALITHSDAMRGGAEPESVRVEGTQNRSASQVFDGEMD